MLKGNICRFCALILVQFIVVGLFVMVYARPDDPTRFAWLNEFGARGRSILTETPKHAAQGVKALCSRLTSDAGPKIGEVDAGLAVLRATGYGVMPTQATSVAQGQLMALDAAQLDAERNLVATLAGAKIKSERSGDKHMLDQYKVHETARAHLLGAKVVDTRYQADGSVEVDMEVKLPRK